MSTSSVALAGRRRKTSSPKAISHTLFGGAAIACLVIGCGWTVYSNIINASAYPTIGDADHVEAVVRRPKLAERSTVQVIHESFAALPRQSAVVAAITRDMFNERFSAAHADGVASNAASVAPAEAPKLAEAPKTRPSSNSPAKGHLPADGRELLQRLCDYDEKMAKQGAWENGALIQHVTQEGVKAGHGADLNSWTGPAIEFAVETTRAFELSRRQRAAA